MDKNALTEVFNRQGAAYDRYLPVKAGAKDMRRVLLRPVLNSH